MMVIAVLLLGLCGLLGFLLIRSERRNRTLGQTAEAAAQTLDSARTELSELTAQLRGRLDAMLTERQLQLKDVEKEREVYKELTAKWSERVSSINDALARLSDDATQKVEEMVSTLKPIV